MEKFSFNNPISFKFWEDRYKKNDETVQDNLHRVAKYIATNEEEEEEFYNLMAFGFFFPGGRTMSNSGIGNNLTINNCFVAPYIKDDLVDIFKKVTLGAKTHQKGGGIGYDFSHIRPQGTPTSNDAIASGPVSFMDVFNAQTATILQGGRRGANMGVLNVYHPDIMTFINAKAENADRLNHFNLSVMVDNNFMKAVENDLEIYLHFPVYNNDGSICTDENKWTHKEKIKAKILWNEIMQKAYNNGEPGIFFYDNMNKDNNLYYIERIVCSNPCSEYLAGTLYGKNPNNQKNLISENYGGACNLGSLFLHNFVKNPFTKNASVDWVSLQKSIYSAVKMLDEVIDVNHFPDKIYENYQKSFRTIGLGETGLADMLCMLNLKYNSKEALKFVDNLYDYIASQAYRASIELAKEKGSFPFLNKEKFVKSGFIQKHKNSKNWIGIIDDIKKYGIRNAKLLSVAPTGTLSLTFGNNCSSGIEPIFSLSYDRKAKIGGQSKENEQIVSLKDYAYGEWEKFKDNSDCIVNKDVFVTALDMTVQEHVDMLGVIAYHTDMSVSKTINVPTDYSFEDAKDIYMNCWKLGIKGCTIFRPNEIRQGIFISDKEKNKNNSLKEESKAIPALKRGDIILPSDDLISFKKTIRTGCGKFYLHLDFDETTGMPYETWIDCGSGGGCERNYNLITRLISLALRGGIPMEEIIDQCKSVRSCGAYRDRMHKYGDTSKGSSCPSAIGYALEELCKKIESIYISNDTDNDEEDIVTIDTKNQEEKPKIIISNYQNEENQNADVCPECGSNIEHIGGCVTCFNCGWSKCG